MRKSIAFQKLTNCADVAVPGPRGEGTLAACGLGWRRDNHSATHTGGVDSRTIEMASKKHASLGIKKIAVELTFTGMTCPVYGKCVCFVKFHKVKLRST